MEKYGANENYDSYKPGAKHITYQLSKMRDGNSVPKNTVSGSIAA